MRKKRYQLAIHTVFLPRENLFFINEWQLRWMQDFFKSAQPFTLNASDPGMRRYRKAVRTVCETFGTYEWRCAIMELGP